VEAGGRNGKKELRRQEKGDEMKLKLGWGGYGEKWRGAKREEFNAYPRLWDLSRI
jgi:hypothetical protein